MIDETCFLYCREVTDFCSLLNYEEVWTTIGISVKTLSSFLSFFNSITTEALLPDSDAERQRICDLVRNKTAVLIVEIGAPTFMRTQIALRTSFGDKIANLGKIQHLQYYSLAQIMC